MKKRGYSVVILTCMMMLLSGCRIYMNYEMIAPETVTVSATMALSPEEVRSMGTDTTDMELQTLEDGKQYYVTPEQKETGDLGDINEESLTLTEDIFVYRLGSNDDMAESELNMGDIYLQMSITLLSDIVDSNADVSVSGKQAIFSSTGNQQGYWYAYTQKGKELVDADKEKPKMSGAKNNKYYKKMPSNIQFTDNIAIWEISLNGKQVTPATSSVTVNGKTTTKSVWQGSNNKDAAKKGKNVFKVKDVKGNVSTFTIYVDDKAPVVKGVKNNKTYKKKVTIYVKDSYRLSKVTINGKKQKLTKKQQLKSGKYKGYYKYTIKKKGTNKIVATDAAGNKKTVKIKIKK